MKHRGYTLVEILLVVAIIGILAALVFAVLAPIRENGRQTVCASKMRQWGMAFAMYRADYEGIDPVQGFPMQASAVGLPPRCFPFLDTYKLIDSPLEACPSDYRVRKIGFTHILSYIPSGCVLDDNDWHIPTVEVITKQGMNLPLVVCENHNPNLDFKNQPSWAKKRVRILRLSQQLSFRELPASATGAYSW